MKYILVTGGVISGIGKGIIASSVGTILKSCGLHVTSIKIDPYINIDAGTFSPYEHGEVFVLDDGGEVDLDLGNYERFLDIRLTKDNNLTTGKIYQYVINKERKGDYLGKTVQVVPHITDAIQEWVMRQARIPVDEDGVAPQVCVIELGGTVGDIESMPFIEAFRQFQFKVKRENFCNIHVSLVPQIVCRCSTPLDTSVKEKISMFCHVEPEQVICVHDVSSIYRVPLLLEEQGVVDYFRHRLDLPIEKQPRRMLMKWKEMADRYDRLLETCSIALVGKYTKFSDSYASVIKALEHSALAINHKLEIKVCFSTGSSRICLCWSSARDHLHLLLLRLLVTGKKKLKPSVTQVVPIALNIVALSTPPTPTIQVVVLSPQLTVMTTLRGTQLTKSVNRHGPPSLVLSPRPRHPSRQYQHGRSPFARGQSYTSLVWGYSYRNDSDSPQYLTWIDTDERNVQHPNDLTNLPIGTDTIIGIHLHVILHVGIEVGSRSPTDERRNYSPQRHSILLLVPRTLTSTAFSPNAYTFSASPITYLPVPLLRYPNVPCLLHGVLVPGGFGVRGTEGKIQAISWARKQKKPFLGVCLGMQLAVVEFARNILSWQDANSTEFEPKTTHPVKCSTVFPLHSFAITVYSLNCLPQVIDMPEHNPGQMGGTMRLGKRRTVFQTKNSVMSKLRSTFCSGPYGNVNAFITLTFMNCSECFARKLEFRGEAEMQNVFLHRDTYSDRSGSSSPDSEITELKFTAVNHE
ncbi:hypothetical protein JD844_005561 [Phrynosoma platyrhinos]|uniref:CTP synthase n=1 Tax=Phrynosoma platyrhinos TaxID=52577 RepID=A0ABQ7TPI2_PHRPL|nr:hypothetical protein JD844_005561 [Phrynosoma platyrhinos]